MEQTEKIARLNDFARKAPGLGARWMVTPGIRALPPELQSKIREKVETFNEFTEGNNPWGERDFGAIEVDGVRVFWKIDYYDKKLEGGSEDPADPRVTTRVLTIMLAEEY